MEEKNIIQRLDQVIRIFLYILFFWLPYSEAVIEMCVAFAGLLWLIKRILLFKSVRPAQAFLPVNTFLNRPIVFFLLVCILSAAGSIYFTKSIHGFFSKTLEWFIIYFLICEAFNERRHILIAFGVFVFSAFAVVADTFVQFYFTHKDIFRGALLESQGANACFKHPNQLAGFLAFVSPIYFCVLFAVTTPKRLRFLFFFLFILTVWALAITFSRAGNLANLLALAICLYFLSRKFFARILLAGLLVLSLLYFALPLNTKKYFRVDPAYVEQTADWRMKVWENSLSMIKEAPLFGHGPNTYMRVFQYYRDNQAHVGKPTYAHNCYIQLAAETGILGLIGFLWIMVEFFRNTITVIRKAKPNEDPFLLCLLVGLLGGIAGFLMQSFFDTHLYSLRSSVLFWCMIGFSVAINRLKFSGKY